MVDRSQELEQRLEHQVSIDPHPPQQAMDCQIAFNCAPPFAFNNDPALVRDEGAETGGAEPHTAEQSRSRRAASGEPEVMRGS
jgi:hypothetical protein